MAHSAALRSPKLYTTDILNEPIAEGGLHFKYEILDDGSISPRILFEALGLYEQIAELELAATKISAGRGQQSNVVDFRSRKPIHSGGDWLSFEVVADAAKGRHSTGYYIFEAIGARRQIGLLGVEAERILRQ